MIESFSLWAAFSAFRASSKGVVVGAGAGAVVVTVDVTLR
jgi:hypothetical protein